jgi:excisionase family DNA binding protein
VNFTVPEAAQWLRCHPDTLRAKIRRGELKAATLNEDGRGYIVPSSEVYRLSGLDPYAQYLDEIRQLKERVAMLEKRGT